MAYAVYTIEITSGNLALESGQVTSAVISRTGGTAPPANAYVTSATSIVTSYYCFSTRYPYFTFNNVAGIGTYFGYSDGLPRHYDSVGTDVVPVYMNDAILSVGTSGTYLSLGIQGGGSGRQVGVYAKGTARETTISITVYYDVRTSASTATFDQNVYAGEQITLTLSNDRISALNHRITATLGSYTTSIQTETGVSSGLEIGIPLEWMNAIPNSTQGTGSMEVATYEGSTLIGAVNYTIYVLVPDDILPTLGA